MIIDIIQTQGTGTRRFEVSHNKKAAYFGEVSAVSSLSACRLLRPDGSVALSTQSAGGFVAYRVLNYVLMVLVLAIGVAIYVFFPPDESPAPFIAAMVSLSVGLFVYVIFKDSVFRFKRKRCHALGSSLGAIEFYQMSGGFLYMYHVIAADGKIFKLFSISQGRFEHISIYSGDAQIGQIDVDLNVYQRKDYRVYLLDSYAKLADILTLFALYYHSMHYARRREFQYGKERSWTYSRANKFYNPSWVADNFKE